MLYAAIKHHRKVEAASWLRLAEDRSLDSKVQALFLRRAISSARISLPKDGFLQDIAALLQNQSVDESSGFAKGAIAEVKRYLQEHSSDVQVLQTWHENAAKAQRLFGEQAQARAMIALQKAAPIQLCEAALANKRLPSVLQECAARRLLIHGAKTSASEHYDLVHRLPWPKSVLTCMITPECVQCTELPCS